MVTFQDDLAKERVWRKSVHTWQLSSVSDSICIKYNIGQQGRRSIACRCQGRHHHGIDGDLADVEGRVVEMQEDRHMVAALSMT